MNHDKDNVVRAESIDMNHHTIENNEKNDKVVTTTATIADSTDNDNNLEEEKTSVVNIPEDDKINLNNVLTPKNLLDVLMEELEEDDIELEQNLKETPCLGFKMCCSTFSVSFNVWAILFFCVGVALNTIALILYHSDSLSVEPDNDNHNDSLSVEPDNEWAIFVMGVVGSFFSPYLVAALIYDILVWVGGYYLIKVQRSSIRQVFVKIIYYTEGASTSIILLMYSFLILGFLHIFVPKSLRDIYNSEFLGCYNLAVFFVIVFIAFVLARLTRLHLSRDFGIRSYKNRMEASLEYENILVDLIPNIHSNKIFQNLYKQIEDDKDNPTVWQTINLYIHRHSVDGKKNPEYHAPIPSGVKPIDVPGLQRSSKIGTKIAKELKRRIIELRKSKLINSENTINDIDSGRTGTPVDHFIFKKDEVVPVILDIVPTKKTVADNFFSKILDPDGFDEVDLKQILAAVLHIYRDRILLSITMQDAEKVVKSLDGAITCAFVILALIIVVNFFSLNLQSGIATIGAFIIAWSFVFGNTIRDSFEGLMFLFSTHIYDVGDIVQFEGGKYEVTRLTLLYTDFLRDDGKFFRIENQKIRSIRLNNLTTSSTYNQALSFYISCTEFEKKVFEEITSKMTNFVKNCPEDYVSISISAREMALGTPQNMEGKHGPFIRITMWVSYTRHNLMIGANHVARTQLLLKLCDIFRELNICQNNSIMNQKKLN